MQWRAVIGIIFALVVAVFAVANVAVEPINFVFGVAHLPLVLIILGSALLGALAVATLGFVGRMRLISENRSLRKSLTQMEDKLAAVTSSADVEPVEKSEWNNSHDASELGDATGNGTEYSKETKEMDDEKVPEGN